MMRSRHRMPGMMAALMIAALAGTEPVETIEARRRRRLNRQRLDAKLLGVPDEEVDALVIELDARAASLARNSVEDWFWAFDEVCSSWQAVKIAGVLDPRSATISVTISDPAIVESISTACEVAAAINEGREPSSQASGIVASAIKNVPTSADARGGRTSADVNRERRARGELGTKRQRKARKSLAISRRSGPS